jgi:hypothetical protein
MTLERSFGLAAHTYKFQLLTRVGCPICSQDLVCYTRQEGPNINRYSCSGSGKFSILGIDSGLTIKFIHVVINRKSLSDWCIKNISFNPFISDFCWRLEWISTRSWGHNLGFYGKVLVWIQNLDVMFVNH